MKRICLVILCGLIAACEGPRDISWKLPLKGAWVVDADGRTMEDPQTSGLIFWRDRLLSVSDRSATEKYRLRIHHLDSNTGALLPDFHQMTFSPTVLQGCFGDYVSQNPDLEAMVLEPADDTVLYIVTEDASMMELTQECSEFAQSNSTEYPSLLLRLTLENDNTARVTHVRPLRFAATDKAGDYANDAFEGLAMSPDGRLYLAREKDGNGKPRIFTLDMVAGFWQQDGFADLVDADLSLPDMGVGNHPINGLAYYASESGSGDYLLAAARNDDQLWLVPLAENKALRQIDISFWAASKGGNCPDWELMDNSSIEGVAVNGQQVWLINDPWKAQYKKNIQCRGNADGYRRMSPLLYPTSMDELLKWQRPHPPTQS